LGVWTLNIFTKPILLIKLLFWLNKNNFKFIERILILLYKKKRLKLLAGKII
jgi:hypothetical protein